MEEREIPRLANQSDGDFPGGGEESPCLRVAVRQGTNCVEVRRVELLSKHILQKLSTCLFCFIVSEINWEQTTD